ncbi:S9 family peptidase [Thalassobacillus pellis]|uniref:S9 family peptidase n=1 Tax=Thalassobacillus pellis TaxID=748008 RepID=UPI001EF87D96|nr:S9 family peptidase [Thalassobacillus pellis]MBM7552569.1 dipeptidyl aminopeptidase/acylaminoacyl peptidase [Thalassobacillus pellis]
MEADNRFISEKDLFNLSSVTDPQWSPDGKGVIYVKTDLDEEEDKYISNLYYYDSNTRENCQWTFGNNRNTLPKWSPDGKKLGFLSDRNEQSQLFIMSSVGGEAKQMTACPNGITTFEWSPDGKSIALQAGLKKNESFHKTVELDKEEKNPAAIVVTDMKYKADGSGLLRGVEQQIGILDLSTEMIHPITNEKHSFQLHCWSPDGRSIAMSGDQAENKDFSFNTELYLYHLTANEWETIPTEKGYVSYACWSPGGSKLGIVFEGVSYKNATHADILLYSTETKSMENITADLDLPVGDFTIADIQQGSRMPGIKWQNDDLLYFAVSVEGNVVIYSGTSDGNTKLFWSEKQHIYGFDFNRTSGQFIFAITTSVKPGELYLWKENSNEKIQVTHHHDHWFNEMTLSTPEEFTFLSTDSWEVHGWILKPVNFDENSRYPFIYQVHGGPHAMYGNTFFHEMQLLAAKGYVVGYINPRGSHGYNQEFVDAVRGDYGGNDYMDIMNGLEYILDSYDFIDRERLGLSGGSYGGFMANWIVSHTNKFNAAVTQRCISNWISFYGVSDIGYYFCEWQLQADLRDFDKLWKQSPLAYADRITTPLLIMHSEDDLRCPIEQAEQLFIALKRQEKETEFIRIPDADHNLSRTGKPSLRMERLYHILRWFEQKL